jgi:hypothetical protein
MRRFNSKPALDDRSANLLAANPRLMLFSVFGGAVALVALLSVAVLASVPPPADLACFDARPGASPATREERLALADARLRELEECQAPWRQCAFDVITSHDSIHVFVERAGVSAGGCLHMIGDHAAHSYDLRGSFQSTSLSL